MTINELIAKHRRRAAEQDAALDKWLAKFEAKLDAIRGRYFRAPLLPANPDWYMSQGKTWAAPSKREIAKLEQERRWLIEAARQTYDKTRRQRKKATIGSPERAA